ncbi:MAG: isoprenylcysteine carboxylmethyltransferase family protein [Chloroflexi bacterium]|nr:isoprenylcysteine carboxylmethyltransferase family protein [Chloroflexota bacterium]
MMEKSETGKKIALRTVIGFFCYLLLNPLIVFLSAGTIRWGMAWVYFGVSTLGMIASRVLAIRKNPDLLEERASYRDAEDAKSWDKALVPIAALYGPITIGVVAGLDMRYRWTDPSPLGVQIAALGLAVFGLAFSAWAMIENRFFSTVVRIQTDRGHTVCDTGPYRWVRHPGYAGGILWFSMTPLIFNSMWAFIPTALTVVTTIIRTSLEDKTLRDELPGYKEYTLRTRYRLAPGIW